jgi:hypothetical protein
MRLAAWPVLARAGFAVADPTVAETRGLLQRGMGADGRAHQMHRTGAGRETGAKCSSREASPQLD